jgi:hypothetical protein
MYVFDTNNRIQLALVKGNTYGNLNNIGSMVYQVPDDSSRQIIGMSVRARVALPLNWVFAYVAWSAGFGVVTSGTLATGSGGTLNVDKLVTFAGADYVSFDVYNNTGANYTNPLETNRYTVTISRLRLVSATTNMVNTTSTANTPFALAMTVTCGSTANMYTGQLLHIGHGTDGGRLHRHQRRGRDALYNRRRSGVWHAQYWRRDSSVRGVCR